jgi:hypothetical protein
MDLQMHKNERALIQQKKYQSESVMLRIEALRLMACSTSTCADQEHLDNPHCQGLFQGTSEHASDEVIS